MVRIHLEATNISGKAFSAISSFSYNYYYIKSHLHSEIICPMMGSLKILQRCITFCVICNIHETKEFSKFTAVAAASFEKNTLKAFATLELRTYSNRCNNASYIIIAFGSLRFYFF